MCRPTVTMPGVELGTGHPGRPGEGLLPGLHFINIYREPLCARRCAGHWGHRDERDTLSTHPCSSPLSQGPIPEPCTEGGGASRTEQSGENQGLEIRTPGFMSTTHGVPDLGPSLASVSPLWHEGVGQDDPSGPAPLLTGDE